MKETDKMLNIIHNNCKAKQNVKQNKRAKRRIKTNILVAILIILLFFLGLVARIDNKLLSGAYVLLFAIIGNVLRKRYNIEVK